jgi:hypothetical protein
MLKVHKLGMIYLLGYFLNNLGIIYIGYFQRLNNIAGIHKFTICTLTFLRSFIILGKNKNICAIANAEYVKNVTFQNNGVRS